MTLPAGDAGFSNRLSLIKRRFTTALVKAGVHIPRQRNGEYALWQRRFWEHTVR
jgi:putative transposase